MLIIGGYMKKSSKILIISISCFVLIAIVVVGILLLGGNKHSHIWNDATCETPKTCKECGEKEGEPHGHFWNNGEVKEEASCTKEGILLYTCTKCSKTKEETISKNNNHKYTYSSLNSSEHKLTCECGLVSNEEHNIHEEIIENATCLSTGLKKIVCSDCGYEEQIVINATGHNWDIDSPTCYSDQTCTTCGEVTPKLVHSYELKSTVEVSCEHDGYLEYECSKCNDTYKNITEYTTGHSVESWTLSKTKENINGNCLYDEVYVGNCNVCNELVEKIESITKHTYEISIKTQATCTNSGIKCFTCNECGATKEEEYNNPDAHNYIEKDVMDNIITYECECGLTKTTINAKEEIETSVDKDALATNELELKHASMKLDEETVNGLKDTDVSLSADILNEDDRNAVTEFLNSDELEALGDNPIYNFLLSQDGAYVSTFNGVITISVKYELEEGEDPESIAIWFIAKDGSVETIKAKYANGLATFETDHFSYYSVTRLSPKERCALYGCYEESTVYPVTCTQDGYTITVCTRCGKSSMHSVIEAKGHNFSDEINEATCSKPGKIIHTCTNSGCTYTHSELIMPLGHKYEVIDKVEATCKNSGYEKFKCSVCNDEYTENHKQTSHQLIVDIIEATCLEQGYKKTTCATCDLEIIDSYTNATGHNYIDTVVEATCTENGYTKHECSNCDDYYIDSEVEASHKYNIDKATCAQEKYCLVCKEVFEEKTDDHNIVDFVCTICGKGCDHTYEETIIEPTCTEDGYTKNVCTKCSHEYISNETSKVGHKFDGFTCTICNETIIEEGFFNQTIANSLEQTYTLHLENFTLNEDMKSKLFIGLMNSNDLYQMFKQINKLEFTFKINKDYYIDGSFYAEIALNVSEKKEQIIYAYGLVEKGILFAKLENINNLTTYDVPTHVYMPIELLFEDNAETIKENIKIADENIYPLIQKLVENNTYVNDFFEELFSKKFTLEEKEQSYIFKSNENLFDNTFDEIKNKTLASILGSDIVKFIEDLKTITIGELLDEIDNFGTSYNDIDDYIDKLIELVSEGEYKSLLEYITEVYGLSALLHKEELYKYTLVSFMANLSDETEETITDEIDQFIEILNEYTIEDILNQMEEIPSIDLDQYLQFEITLNKDKTVNNIKVEFEESVINITTNYTSDVDYQAIKKEIQDKYNNFKINRLVEESDNKHFGTYEDKNVIVETFEDSHYTNAYEYVEYNYELQQLKKYYRVETYKSIHNYYYDYSKYGVVWYNNSQNEVSVTILAKNETKNYNEIIDYDIETLEIVNRSENISLIDSHEDYYLTSISLEECEHEFIYVPENSIIIDSCCEIGKKAYVCKHCDKQTYEYYTLNHYFVYDYEFLTNENDCEEGVKVKKVCKDCNIIIDLGTSYYHNSQSEYVDLREYENPCNHEIEIDKCPCNYNLDIIIDNEYIDRFYVCKDCGLTIITSDQSKSDNCQRIRKIMYQIIMGNTVIESFEKEIIISDHDDLSVIYELLDGSTSCKDGVKKITECAECGLYEEEILYECHNEHGYYLLTDLDEYGYENKIYQYCYNCKYCSKFVDETNRIKVTGDVESLGTMFIIDNSFYIYMNVDEQKEENCKLTRKYILYINYDLKSKTYDKEYILGEETYTDHEYVTTYELIEGATSCEDGVIEKQTCINCEKTYEYNYNYHHEIEKTIIDFSEYGCEHGCKYTTYGCLCGYNSGYSNWRNMNPYYEYDNNTGERYLSYYQCYNCDLKVYIKNEQIPIDDCHVQNISSYEIHINNELQNTLIFEKEKETHDWKEYVYLDEGSSSCIDGCYSIVKCSNCGIYDEEKLEYNHYHKEGIITSIDLTQYGALNGQIVLYGCACYNYLNVEAEGYYNYYGYYEEYGYLYRSPIDGYTWAYNIINESNECELTKTLTLYLGISLSSNNYFKQIKEVYTYHIHDYYKTEEYQLINGVDCKHGTINTYKCDTCEHETKRFIDDHVMIEIDKITFENSDAYLAIYGCPCGNSKKETKPVGFEYKIEEYSDEKQSIYQEIYYDENNNIEYIISSITKYLSDCNIQYIQKTELFINGILEEEYEYDEYTESQHDIIRFVTLTDEASSCYEGVIVEEKCTKCDYVESTYETDYHVSGITKYINLKDYGAEDGSISIRGCACGYNFYNVYYNFEYDYSYDNEDNRLIFSSLDGYCIKEVFETRTEECLTKEYRILYLDYNLENKTYAHKIEIPQEVYENHTYNSTYKLLGENCYSGVLITSTCEKCNHIFEETIYYHYEYQEFIEISDEHLTCEGKVVITKCPCGYNYDVKIDTICDFDSDYTSVKDYYFNGYYYFSDSYTIYKCAVTEPQCKFSYIEEYYTVFDGCNYKRYKDIYLYQDNYEATKNIMPTYHLLIQEGNVHTYEKSIVVTDTDIQCYKMVNEKNICTKCNFEGHTYTYYDWYHEEESSVVTTTNGHINIDKCKHCDSYKEVEYIDNNIVRIEGKSYNILSNMNDDELVYELCTYKEEYMYYKGYKYQTYDEVKKEYTDEIKNQYGYKDSYQLTTYKYDFTNKCRVTITKTLNDETSTYTKDICKLVRYEKIIKDSTCSQTGEMLVKYGCVVCNHNIHEFTQTIYPKGHNWEYSEDACEYVCTRCDLHNINGANGNVTLEDCSDVTSNTDDIVIGYWNPYGYKYQLYVSLMIKDEYLTENEDNQVVLNNVTFTYLEEGSYVTFSRAQVENLATDLGYSKDMYDIRLSFVPVTYDLDLDYAITITN